MRAVAVPLAVLLTLVPGAAFAGGSTLPPPPPPPTTAPPPSSQPPPSTQPPPSNQPTPTTTPPSTSQPTSSAPSPTNQQQPSSTQPSSSSTRQPSGPSGQAGGPRSGSWYAIAIFLHKDTTGSLIVLSPVLGTRFQLVGPVWAEALVGMSTIVVIGNNGAGEAFVTGDPYVGVDWIHHVPGMTIYAGGGLTLPLAQSGAPAAYEVSEGMRARWDPWLWAPATMAAVLKGRIDLDGPGGLQFGGEAGLGTLFWLGSGNAPTLVDAQLGGDVRYRLGDVFSVGLRATAVIGEPESVTGQAVPGNLLQLGLAPYIRASGGGAGYELRFIIPVGGPYGFGGPNGVWGLEVGGGIGY